MRNAIARPALLTLALAVGGLQIAVATFPHAATAEEEAAAKVTIDRTGLTVTSPDGAFKFNLGGRVHVDATVHAGDTPSSSPTNNDATDGTEIRRARLVAKATVWDDWRWVGELDFADNSAAIKDFTLGYSGLERTSLSVGHQKQPFSLSIEMSSNDLTFVERPPDIDMVIALLDRAIGVRGEHYGDKFFLAAGFYGDGADAQTDKNNEGFGAAGRVVVTPIRRDDKVLHFGVRSAYRRPETSNEVVSFKTETTHMSNYNVLSTGSIEDVDDAILYGPEAAFAWGPFSIWGEYTRVKLQRNGFDTLQFEGGHVATTWSITGESRAAAYAIKSGEFKRLKPAKHFSVRNGGCGAWELGFRYAYLNLNDGGGASAVDGGKQQSLDAALNWYLNPNARLMFNYRHVLQADAAGPAIVTKEAEGLNAFTLRAQFYF